MIKKLQIKQYPRRVSYCMPTCDNIENINLSIGKTMNDILLQNCKKMNC